MNRALWLSAAIVPSFLAVLGLVVHSEVSLSRGVEVRLEVRPYDPMDALSGRYLAVPLAIERLDPALVRGGRELGGGETVWVHLAPGTPWWSATAVTTSPPADDTIALRGAVHVAYAEAIWVEYGFDRFYIPHEGADPTRSTERPELGAVVRITPEGRGYLTDLLVDGESWSDWSARQE